MVLNAGRGIHIGGSRGHIQDHGCTVLAHFYTVEFRFQIVRKRQEDGGDRHSLNTLPIIGTRCLAPVGSASHTVVPPLTHYDSTLIGCPRLRPQSNTVGHHSCTNGISSVFHCSSTILTAGPMPFAHDLTLKIEARPYRLAELTYSIM